MENIFFKKRPEVLSNGTCSNCGKLIRKPDREDKEYVFYLITGMKLHRGGKTILIKCPECDKFITF